MFVGSVFLSWKERMRRKIVHYVQCDSNNANFRYILPAFIMKALQNYQINILEF